MSGGSYNYLCHADTEDLMSKTNDIEAMSDRLAGLGFAPDAAKETMQLLLTVRQYENRITVMRERLQGVWRAVEWWDSCDSDEESVKKALAEYRCDK